MKEKRIIFQKVISILFVFAFLIFSTLFIFLPRQEEMAGAFSYLGRLSSLSFVEVTDNLALKYPYPITDLEGQNTEAYEFNIVNNGNDTRFQLIFLTGKDENRIPQDAINYVIATGDGEYSEVRTLPSDGIIIDEVIASHDTLSYALKFWVHDKNNDSILGTTFEAMLQLEAVK